MSADKIVLNCWVEGDVAEKVFSVATHPSDDTVSCLRRIIHTANRNRFELLDFPSLDLWKANIHKDNFSEDFAKNINLQDYEELFGGCDVSEHWLEGSSDILHVIVGRPQPYMIKFYCLIEGDTVGHLFPVNIQPNGRIADLKTLIYAATRNTFRAFDAHCLRLWKVDIPLDDDSLNEHVNNINLHNHEELQARRKIVSIWPNGNSSINTIRIIVKKPLPTPVDRIP